MRYAKTTATKKIAAMSKRLRCVAGGTSASKTVSILIYLISKSLEDLEPTLTSVVSESFPHLKRGVMRDFISILEDVRDAEGNVLFDDSSWNRTDFIYTLPNGSRIEFFSADQPDKVRGPRRDRLFINEANNVPYDAFDQLEVRTKDFAFLDWNPVSEFWFYTDVMGRRDDVEFLTLTYLDNEALDPQIVASIEQRKANKRWWTVYGEGKLGEVGGRIYTDWALIDDIPHEARLERYGVDFGYSNDPTAIVGVYRHDGGFILDEVCYRTGMKNREIADLLLNLPQTLVVADSAEPKSIDEIAERGISIVPCEKGKGSVNAGIQFVQDQRVSVTKRSVNLLKEYRNYLWLTDKDGKTLNEPDHEFSHCMDAARYALASMKSPDPGEARVSFNPNSSSAYRYGASRMAGIRNGACP